MPSPIPPKLADRPTRGRANLRRLRGTTDAVIADTAPPELRDLDPRAMADAVRVLPLDKRPRTLRLDAHVVAWFRAHGPRSETRMQLTLRAYMKRIARARSID